MCETKKCTKCTIEKKFEDFSKHKLGAYGIDSVCKNCKKELKNKLSEIYREINNTRDYIAEEYLLIKCNSCKMERECREFHKNLTSKRGYCNICIQCYNEKLESSRRESPKFKKCSECDKTKEAINFGKQKYSRDGLHPTCKECCAVREKIKYSKNKETILKRNKKWRVENKESQLVSKKEYYLNNKERILERSEKYYQINKEVIKEKVRWYTKTDRFKNNRKEKRKDPLYLLKIKLQNLILHEFTKQNLKKDKKTTKILDCSIEEFKVHIESQFLPWMNWENYGNCDTNDYNCSWQLDHVIPISWAATENEIHTLNHWSNFQPLCSKVNKWEKRNIIFPVCNRELNLTAY